MCLPNGWRQPSPTAWTLLLAWEDPMLDVRRREFITLLGGAAAWPVAVRAQQRERIRRIGVGFFRRGENRSGGAQRRERIRRIGGLFPGAANDQGGQSRLAAFLQGLQPLGWTDGRNVQIEYRWGGSDGD